jgi:hypothetical protein
MKKMSSLSLVMVTPDKVHISNLSQEYHTTTATHKASDLHHGCILFYSPGLEGFSYLHAEHGQAKEFSEKLNLKKAKEYFEQEHSFSLTPATRRDGIISKDYLLSFHNAKKETAGVHEFFVPQKCTVNFYFPFSFPPPFLFHP